MKLSEYSNKENTVFSFGRTGLSVGQTFALKSDFVCKLFSLFK